MDAVLDRKSIRKYTDQEISEDIVKTLLRAGMSAPSAGNERPWEFIVIKDRNILKRIGSIDPTSFMLEDAKMGILVCGNLNKVKFDGEFWVQDTSAATENILIEAHSHGVGSVWVGLHPKPEIQEFIGDMLSLPKEIIPFSMVSLGYPAETKPDYDKYDESCVHYERW